MPIYRFNEYYCGDNYLDVQIYPEHLAHSKGKRRKGMYKPTRACQQALNDNNRDRHLCRLINHNFTRQDFFVTLTYKDAYLPGDYESGQRDLKNYIRRLRRHAQKLELPVPKIVAVSGYGERRKRLHHHLIVSGVFPAAVYKSLWEIRTKTNGNTGYELRGRIDVDPLEFTQFGVDNLVKYFMKHINENKKRGLKCTYFRSRNLQEPVKSPRVKRLRAKQIVKIAQSMDFSAVEEIYKPYRLVRPEEYDDEEELQRMLYYNEEYGGYYFLLRFYKPPKRFIGQRKGASSI